MIQNLLIFAAIAAASLVRADVGKVPSALKSRLR